MLKLDSSDAVRKAVISGKADYGMLISINAADDELVPVERFDTRAEYMVLSNKRYNLLQSFDSALLNIVETNPDFRKMAFSEYYGKAASQDQMCTERLALLYTAAMLISITIKWSNR